MPKAPVVDNAVGEQLFQLVAQEHPEFAPKLTGMLLQLGVQECRACLTDPERLKSKIGDAFAILDEANQTSQAQAKATTTPARSRGPRAPATKAPPGAKSAPPVAKAAAPPGLEERRIDPEDGRAKTLQELRTCYAAEYSAQEIAEYWESCKVAGPAPAAPGRGAAGPGAAGAGAAARRAPAERGGGAGDAAPPAKGTRPQSGPGEEGKQPSAGRGGAVASRAKPAPASAPSGAAAATAAEAIPGLTAFLKELKLVSYAKAAVKWAEEQGAISLEEIVENLTDFADDLSMKPLERKRLLEGAERAVKGAAPSPSAPGGKASAVEDEEVEEQQAPARRTEDEDGDEEKGEEIPGSDAFNEAQMGNLDVERDFAMMSRMEDEEEEPTSQRDPLRPGAAASMRGANPKVRLPPPTTQLAKAAVKAIAQAKAPSSPGASAAAAQQQPAKAAAKTVLRARPAAEAAAPAAEEKSPQQGSAEAAATEASPPPAAAAPAPALQVRACAYRDIRVVEAERAAAAQKAAGEAEAAAASVAPANGERRIDPEDGVARTLHELRSLCAGKYSDQEIEQYWATCQPVNQGGRQQGGPSPHWGAGRAKQRF